MANHVNAPTGVADVLLHNGACKLSGFSCRESAAIAGDATFILRDGIDATGAPVAFVEVPANRSLFEALSSPIECKVGLFLDRVAGETEVVAYDAR